MTTNKRRTAPIETLPEWCLKNRDLHYSARILLFFILYNVNLNGRVTYGRLREKSKFPHETLNRNLKSLTQAGIIDRVRIRESKHECYSYAVNTERLKELGAPRVEDFFRGYTNK